MQRSIESDGYWFTSNKFELEPDEDKEINPGVYGRQLARWLKQKLEEKGYAVEDIINEEWGRCLVCSREPFKLWVGCKSKIAPRPLGEESAPPSHDKIVWYCFVAAEIPHFTSYFWKVDPEPAKAKLFSTLGDILLKEPAVVFVEQP
jgi:hypothetical protein